ncbi:MAG: NAD-dependent protein deacylase [candidate division Zixibacteria bacterium RBG_16_40_9]|nr:MAG: NAD-dependent protein deacylase [candidate division Zixibacteria bacterium RBG_16_40_9]
MPNIISLSTALQQKLVSAKKVVVLTGAGVSQESGISTFRDKDGLWQKFKPEDLATPQAFEKNPKMVWEWYDFRRKKIQTVQPNFAHLAISQMEKIFSEFLLVTQNVDGLHQKAGSKKILELHGNLNRNKCFSCERIYKESDFDSKTVPPVCKCGGYLRPDVVWFGELLPELALEQAQQAASQAELFFSIGTSAIVYPAASLPFLAKEKGAFVVEINTSETEISAFVDELLLGKAGVVLPVIVEFLRPKGKK